MSDNKLLAILAVAVFAAIATMAVFGKDSNIDSEATKMEKEKTKQLILQYKIDSLNNIRDSIKNDKP